MCWGELGKRFFILTEFINSAPSSCRAILFYFLPFFLRICLGERYGCPSPALIPRCLMSPCVHLSPLYFSSSRRRNRYWIRSSCSIGTLSMPCLFHCSSMFGRSMLSLSTISLRSGSFIPTSVGVIYASSSTSCMGVLACLVSPSIGVVLSPCSILLLELFVFSFRVCSLASLDFTFSFPPSSPLLVLSRPSIRVLDSVFLLVGALLGFLFSLILWFGLINPSSSYCILVFSFSCFLLRGNSMNRFPCSWHLLHMNGIFSYSMLCIHSSSLNSRLMASSSAPDTSISMKILA